MATVKEQLVKIVAEILEMKIDKIEDQSRFVEDLDAESIQSIELMAAFEEEFDIEMDEDEAMAVKTVGDAVTFITQCIEEQR
ncbi:acyl carrier protein [Desulfobacter latus]|uniref:Acyl carrier protein n=1 Tax=Desulfobacter latus TaxID=2292 RepID=A0A850T1V0_9BACT|nr:acyl carrier protein [Desulfobacter latus]NWH06330.1 acyl carrier protein [Desulfobacter latus]